VPAGSDRLESKLSVISWWEMNGETDNPRNLNIEEMDESLELDISEDEDDEAETQIERNDQAEDCGLSFKEISEEWKMVAWFTESICVR
jgi:hypothetical protein